MSETDTPDTQNVRLFSFPSAPDYLSTLNSSRFTETKNPRGTKIADKTDTRRGHYLPPREVPKQMTPIPTPVYNGEDNKTLWQGWRERNIEP